MGFVFVVIFLRYFLGIMTDVQEVAKIQKSPRWEIKFDLISWQCENSFPQSLHLQGKISAYSQAINILGSFSGWKCVSHDPCHWDRVRSDHVGPHVGLHPMLFLLLWLMGVQRPLANGMFCLFIKFNQCQFLKKCLGLRAALNPGAGIWQAS